MAILFFGLIKLANQFEFVKDLNPETKADKYLMMIGIIIMVHIVLMVHELGHLLMGMIQGFRFELFVVGLLGIRRENERIKVYLNKNLGYYGGVAATSPMDDSPENPKKLARVILAGPIASILFAIVCFLAASYFGKPLGMIAYTGGMVSIGIFLATTVPSKTGMFFTDRKRYQRLVRPGKDQQVELAMLNIIGKFRIDNSYKNIDKKDIEILISDETPYVTFFGLFNMICWQLEHTRNVEESIKSAYASTSSEMPKNLVAAYDNEIEKYAEQFKRAC